MPLKQIMPFLLGFFLFIACSDKDGRPVNESVSAFINGNEKVISFGSVDYQTIMNKAEYKSIPKFGNIIEDEMNKLGNSLNTETPVYYVLEGPMDNNGNPAATYAFFDVKNRDSLVERLGSSGLFVEDAGDMKYTTNGDVSIGAKGNLAILITKKEKYDAKASLEEAFKKAKGDVAGGKTDKLLAKKGDITFNLILQNLYGTSNTDLAKLDESKQKELQAMMNDSYTHSSVSFEKGKMVFATENLFSDALQKRMFFKQDSQAKVLAKLGKGKARVGLTANIEMEKLENFIDDFAPEFKQEMISSRSETAIAVMLLGDNPLTKVFSGVAGLVVVGDPKMGSFIPDVNFNVGIGKSGKSLFEIWAGNAASDQFVYKVTDTDLIGNSPNAGAGTTALTIPDCGKDFGKEGISGFIDFEGLNIESFGLPSAYKSVNLVKNITFKYNNKGGEFVINTINKDQNILKQLIDLYVKDIEKTVNNISI